MDIFHMTSKVAALSECLVALGTFEGPDACVLSEVIPEVTALFEDAAAALVLTFEEQLDALCLFVLNLNCFMPVIWNSNKCFHIALVLPVVLIRPVR